MWETWEGIRFIHRRPWQAEVHYTEEEARQLYWAEKDWAKAFISKYHLDALLLVNTFFKVSFEEWIRLPRGVQLAMVQLAEEQSRELENARRLKEKELEEKMNNMASRVRLPNEMPSALPRLMGYI